MAETSIVQEEIEQFGKLAGDWWDPKGASAMLHRLNPVRLAYIRDWIDQHWSLDEHSRRPLDGKSALDVGCGAGLLAEPLARLGAKVTAIDPAPELIGAAREHAAGQGLQIDYRVAAVEDLQGAFDLITSMEVIEHTSDPQQFLIDLAKRLAPNGLLMMSTPNATGWSKLITITLAEGFGAIPKGTHDFDKFIAPERMKQLMANAGLKCLDVEGLAFSPTRGLHLSEDLRLNYLVAATHS
ncbi:bifunctional 2-polyprenyl-6-hydroxyphenol methylase/3-demethylubiquinol 3-O-methyltransferase UbiG [Sphingomonas daechungensis]|uniref:bifunctional 2-polyprenyl-6-hydroxyphenol methylase/3-demethylubiquinol 3-O-methyltransferase UbiG n=1 Tax=Sphingomonas daechungensis TaxID=1176646 RepID=UPI0037846ECD